MLKFFFKHKRFFLMFEKKTSRPTQQSRGDSIARSYNDHHLYTTRNLPGSRPIVHFEDKSKDEELLKKLRNQKNPLLRMASLCFKYCLIAILFPFYFTLFVLPKWICMQMKKVIQIVLPPLKSMCRKCVHMVTIPLQWIAQKIHHIVTPKVHRFKNMLGTMAEMSKKASKNTCAIVKSISTIKTVSLRNVLKDAWKLLSSLGASLAASIKNKARQMQQKIVACARGIHSFQKNVRVACNTKTLTYQKKGRFAIQRIAQCFKDCLNWTWALFKYAGHLMDDAITDLKQWIGRPSA